GAVDWAGSGGDRGTTGWRRHWRANLYVHAGCTDSSAEQEGVRAARPSGLLAGLEDTLRDAHELVVSCPGRSTAYQVFMAGRQAERFKEVQSNIDFYLMLFPVISHIDVTCRLGQ
uniref:Uncharacterized protein n=1 Tax=Aegilops tauschii subsp. strangulata TaxID=200361 RepID=A0A453QCL3_AEGTS